MIVRLAGEQDTPGFIVLAGQVEHWFGPMVDDPGFRAVIDQHIRRATALVAVTPGEPGLLGGPLFRLRRPTGSRRRSWRPEPGTGTSPR